MHADRQKTITHGETPDPVPGGLGDGAAVGSVITIAHATEIFNDLQQEQSAEVSQSEDDARAKRVATIAADVGSLLKAGKYWQDIRAALVAAGHPFDEASDAILAATNPETGNAQQPSTDSSTEGNAVADHLIPLVASEWARQQVPAPDQIITDSVDMGTKVVLVAPSKARKSFLLLQMAIALAAGLARFLNWPIPQTRTVLVVNLEITGGHFHRRLVRMLTALGVSPEQIGDRLLILNARGIDGETIKSKLAAIVAEHKVEVVIIDPVYKLIPGDESKQEIIKELLRFFDGLCTQTECCLFYCHHAGKGEAGDRLAIDRASGSGVLARDFDTMFTLTQHIEDNLVVVEQIARSYPPKDAFCIRWDDAGCFVTQEGVAPVVRNSFNRNRSGRVNGKTLTEDDAMQTVEAGPLQAKAMIEALRQRGFTARAAEAMRDKLVKDGRLYTFEPRTYPRKVYYGTVGQIDEIERMKPS